MKPRDLRQLLGGFAAGTLTSEEREALCRAALEDQALFDALADEEALRELLADPVARARLLGDLKEAPRDFWSRLAGWMRKPATLALAGTAAALLLVVGTVRFTQREAEAPKLVAQAPHPVELPPPAAMVRRPEAKPMRRATPPAVSEQQVAPPAPALLQQREAEAPKLVAQAPRPAEMAPPAAVVQRPESKPINRAAPPRASEQQVAPPAPALLQQRDTQAPPAAVVQLPEAKPIRRAAPPQPAPALQEKRAEQPAPAPLTSAVLVRDAGGGWRETTPGAAFREGDQVRLRVRAAEDGYVLVTVQDGSIVTSLVPPVGMAVRSGQDVVVPPTGALTLSGTSGEKLLRLSFSTDALVAPGIGMQFARGAGAPAAAKTAAKVSPPPQQIEIRLHYRPQ